MFGISVDKATNNDYKNAKPTELFCKTGFNNIKGKGNEQGKNDYVHIKTEKSFVKFKVIDILKDEAGNITSIKMRPVKPTAGKEVEPEVDPREKEIKELKAKIEGLERDRNDYDEGCEAYNALDTRVDELKDELNDLENEMADDEDEE